MLYLRSFHRFILVSLALLGLSVSSVNASLFEFQFEDTIGFTNITGLDVGNSAKITLGLDNGGTSNVSQTWTAGDLLSVTWDFNNGGLVTTFNSPWGGALDSTSGDFVTDVTGTLTNVMSNWHDSTVGSDFVTNGSAAPFFWILDVTGNVYADITLHGVSLSNAGSMLTASNWSPVSAVPVPAAIWLFGTALIGLVGFSKRSKAA
jgi:hypothetical protein